MRQTLLHIPQQIAGVPLFGFGILFALWLIASVATLIGPIRKHGFNQEVVGQIMLTLVIGAAILFLLPALIGAEGLPIRGFGVMLLVAVLASWYLAQRRARQVGLDPEVIFSMGVVLFLWGIAGARLFYVVQKWDEFRRPGMGLREVVAEVFNVTQGGLVFYGSLIAGAAAFFYYTAKHKLPALAIADVVTPALLIGMAIGRVGCFLNGCCYGGPCELPWKVTFPWGSPPHFRQVQTGLIDQHGLIFDGSESDPAIVDEVVPGSLAETSGIKPGDKFIAIGRSPDPLFEVKNVEDAQRRIEMLSAEGATLLLRTADRLTKNLQITGPLPRSEPVHPAQLYAAVDAFLICLLVWVYYPFRRRDGEGLALMLTVYPITRFLIEVIRTDELPVFLGMTISQNISVLILLIAAGLWTYILRQPPGTANLAGRTLAVT